MQSKIKKILCIISFLWVCIISAPLQVKAQGIAEISADIVREENASIGFDKMFTIIFKDTDGKFKMGKCEDVFTYVKQTSTNPNINKNKNTAGDYYDSFSFAHILSSEHTGSLAKDRSRIRDITYCSEQVVQLATEVHKRMMPYVAILLVAYFCLGLSNLAEQKRATKRDYIKKFVYMLLACAILINLEKVSTIYCAINNSLTAQLTQKLSIEKDDGLEYYTFAELERAVAAADKNSFSESNANMRADVFNLEFGFVFRQLSQKGGLITMYAFKLLFCISLILLPIAITDLPLGEFHSTGVKILKNELALCLVPSFYIMIYTLAIRFQESTSNTTHGTTIFGTFIIPLSVLIILGTAKTIAQEMVGLMIHKYK